MKQEIDSNTFTQKDLMQHLLQASQHAVTREEMAAQFRNAEQQNKERFAQVEKCLEQAEQQNKERFEQVEKRFVQAEQQNKERFEQVEKRFVQAEQQNKERFDQAEQQNKERFAQVDKQLEMQHQALMEMGQNIQGVHQEIKHQMRWNLGILVSVGGLVLGILKFTGT